MCREKDAADGKKRRPEHAWRKKAAALRTRAKLSLKGSVCFLEGNER